MTDWLIKCKLFAALMYVNITYFELHTLDHHLNKMIQTFLTWCDLCVLNLYIIFMIVRLLQNQHMYGFSPHSMNSIYFIYLHKTTNDINIQCKHCYIESNDNHCSQPRRKKCVWKSLKITFGGWGKQNSILGPQYYSYMIKWPSKFKHIKLQSFLTSCNL